VRIVILDLDYGLMLGVIVLLFCSRFF